MPVVFKQISLATVLFLVGVSAEAYAQVDAGTTQSDAAPPARPHVEPLAPEPPPPPTDPAYPPERASGLEVPRDPPDGTGRRVGRVMLAPLRGLWLVVWSPVRLFAWSYDRYALRRRARATFFSEGGGFGFFPVLAYKSSFGITAGARLEVRDVFNVGSRLRLTATYRGEVLQAYTLRHRTGRLFGRAIELETRAGFETFPKSRFYGIGNGDQQIAGTLMNVDPLTDDTAVGTIYYHDAATAELAAIADVPGPFWVRLSGGYELRDFDDDFNDGDVDVDDRNDLDDDHLEISDVYDPARIPGFQGDLSNVQVEAAVVFSTLRQERRDLSHAMPSAGWYVRGRLGYAAGLDDDPSNYLRWGLDVQRYLDLYRGDRVLVLRAYVEGVSGSLADVPFTDLPRLGGSAFLRGYQQDRFRDRRAGFASVEYQWGIDRNLSAFVFTDVGRVWRNLDDLQEGDPRVGFGGGLQVHTMKNFLARAMATSSADGRIFVFLSFDPLVEQVRR